MVMILVGRIGQEFLSVMDIRAWVATGCSGAKIFFDHLDFGGSEPARDGGVPVSIVVYGCPAIASRLTPTGKLGGNNCRERQSNEQFFAAHCRAVFLEMSE